MNLTQMAAKLYEARDHAKMLYGKSWREKLKPVEDSIRQEMEFSNTDNAPLAVLNMVKRQKACPEVAIILLAAAVQITEPE